MPRPLRLLALAPLLGLALAACSTSGGTAAPHGDANDNQATTVGGGLLPKPLPAPVLTGPTIGGGQLSTAQFAGSVVVINFYASWCAPCAAETPYLQSVAAADPAVHFVGVLSDDTETNGAAFRATHHVTYPSLVDTTGGDVAKFRSLSPSGLPVTFVLDKQGKIAARYIGGITAASGLQTVLTTLQDQT